jgi:hypothetical protein
MDKLILMEFDIGELFEKWPHYSSLHLNWTILTTTLRKKGDEWGYGENYKTERFWPDKLNMWGKTLGRII